MSPKHERKGEAVEAVKYNKSTKELQKSSKYIQKKNEARKEEIRKSTGSNTKSYALEKSQVEVQDMS